MHPQNIHKDGYNISALIQANPSLNSYIFTNKYGSTTIDFSNQNAVFELNKALLIRYHNITEYSIPQGYLCPPVPGRADYLYYINDLLLSKKSISQRTIKGIDIGAGANCIYPILAASLFKWDMLGTDIDSVAVENAKSIVIANNLKKHIQLCHQTNNANIFEGIITESDYFDFTMCNPPFYASEKEANKATIKKTTNLNPGKGTTVIKRNFGGQSNELWCNGGEALFIKRMIKQSIVYKNQVGIFTTLVSRKENLPKLYKQLNKLNTTHQTIKMSLGNKVSHILVWEF